MLPLRTPPIFWRLMLTLLACVTARAQESPPAAARAATADDEKDLRKISGIFDTDLPKTARKGTVRLLIHPHLGDFTSRNYLRIVPGIRWGVSDHVELSALVEAYLDHHLKGGSPGNGIGALQFSGKYAFSQWLKPDYDASVGINTRIPIAHPPIDLTDGYNHYTPYLVISRKSPATKGLTYYASSTLDLMEKSSVRGIFRKNEAHSSSLTFGTGFVLDRYPYHYTLETGYQTIALVGQDNQQFVFLRPGFAWDLPRRLTFNSQGRWLVGVSVKFTVGPDGTRIDSGGKLRGELNIRRWFSGDKKTAPDPRSH